MIEAKENIEIDQTRMVGSFALQISPSQYVRIFVFRSFTYLFYGKLIIIPEGESPKGNALFGNRPN